MAHRTMQNENMRVSYREGTLDGEHIFENHSHTRYEMIAVFEGKISIVADNEKYMLGAGEIIMIPPLTYHSVFTVGDITYKRATVLFDESLIPSEIRDDFNLKISSHPVSRESTQRGLMKMLLDIFAEENIERYMPLVSGLLTEAMYIHTYRAGESERVSVNPTVTAVVEYIDSHFREKILLDDMAASLFLSKSTVCHVFQSEMKISPKQYILQKKLAYAASLILSGTAAAEAAREVGYENYANFYKAFKKAFGESPREKKRNA